MNRTVRTVMMMDLRRLGRDRLALFFLLVLPFVLVIFIGELNEDSGTGATVAVVDHDNGPVAKELVGSLDDVEGIDVSRYSSRGDAERDVRIGQVSAVAVIPDGFSARVSAGDAVVSVISDPTRSGGVFVSTQLGNVVNSVGARLTVARALERAGVDDPDRSASDAIEAVGSSEVDTVRVGSGTEFSVFAFAAGSQMFLFMFVNSLTAGGMLIEMRRLGVLDRIRAGPVSSSDVVTGFGLSRFVVACGLAVLILVFASVAYGVSWGSPAVVVPVVVLFGLVSVGASTLIGTLLDNPDSAVSVGVPIALGMAALGGCMFPLFLAPAPMQVAAKILTPHAWAITALMDTSVGGAGLADLWPNLLVLAVWATVLLGLARFSTRRFGR